MNIQQQLAQSSRFSINGFEIRSQWCDHDTVLEVLITKPEGERFSMSERMWEPVKGTRRIEFVRTRDQICEQVAQRIHDVVYGDAPH